jgi:hypothetical protein
MYSALVIVNNLLGQQAYSVFTIVFELHNSQKYAKLKISYFVNICIITMPFQHCQRKICTIKRQNFTQLKVWVLAKKKVNLPIFRGTVHRGGSGLKKYQSEGRHERVGRGDF